MKQLDTKIQEKHIGKIADSMFEWEGPIAEELELRRSDIADIKTEHKKMNLQM